MSNRYHTHILVHIYIYIYELIYIVHMYLYEQLANKQFTNIPN